MNIKEAYKDAVLDIWSIKGEKSTCTISGNSMAPLIKHGESLVIAHGNQHIRVGDILVFKTAEKIIAHRLVHIDGEKGQERLLLKGDQIAIFDEPIQRAQVLGRIIEIQGANGHFILDSKSWRLINIFLARISYCTAKGMVADSLFWKVATSLWRLQVKIMPREKAARPRLISAICRIMKTKSSPRS